MLTKTMILAAVASGATTAGAETLPISALRLGVTDVEASVRFYETHLGFSPVIRYPSGAAVLQDPEGVYLVLTAAQRPVERPDGACYVRFNFAVPDLDDAIASMESSGVRFTGRDESAVGGYATFIDPSGHAHNIKELHAADEPIDGPRVYNAGIAVSDMAAAREFYEAVLGFEALSDAYYPPVVPMKPAGRTMFILSDRNAREPAIYDYDAGVFAGLALEAADLVETAGRLRQAGVEFVHEQPVDTGPVILMAFRDPFGNVHELIQHVPYDPGRSSPTLQDAAFLTGTWHGELGGTPLEETWAEPRGDHMLGMLRWLDTEGASRMYEIFTLTETDEGLVYRLRHFDGELEPWTSEASGAKAFRATIQGRRIVFEPLSNVEGIVRASYDASQEGRLVFRIDFEPQTQRPPLVIEFERR